MATESKKAGTKSAIDGLPTVSAAPRRSSTGSAALVRSARTGFFDRSAGGAALSAARCSGARMRSTASRGSTALPLERLPGLHKIRAHLMRTE